MYNEPILNWRLVRVRSSNSSTNQCAIKKPLRVRFRNSSAAPRLITISTRETVASYLIIKSQGSSLLWFCSHFNQQPDPLIPQILISILLYAGLNYSYNFIPISASPSEPCNYKTDINFVMFIAIIKYTVCDETHLILDINPII